MLNPRRFSPLTAFVSAAPRIAVAGVALLLLGSCTGSRPESPGPTSFAMDTGAEAFSIGYEGIADLYVEPVPTQSLALAALDGVAALDPAIDFVRRGDSLIVTETGTPFAKFTVPGDDNPTKWARLTAAALEAARQRSLVLSETTADRLYEVAFDAIAGKLDRFSRYHNAAETRAGRAARKGYTGIGVTIGEANGSVIVASVFHGSPASTAGLLPGDRFVSVAGHSVTDKDMEATANLLRGTIGTTVAIRIARGTEERTFEILRQRVIEDTVSYAAVGGMAYFKVSGFNSDTAHALSQALLEAKAALGDDLPGIILDLRQNRGGTLDEAVEVADLFVDHGIILETQGRHSMSRHRYDAEYRTTATLAPIAVLIDSGSASAAEVVAAALQDSGRALVIGARSYGKGTVQRVIDIPPISSELILTWARMHAPSGYALSDFGVFPSICTPDYGDDPEVSAAALESGELRLSETMQKRLYVTRMDETERQKLLGWCHADHPPSTTDSDTRLAVRLLSDRKLFQLAFHASRVALGERPKDPN
ncbi:S41 family peptidase [Thalassobaculum sp. OXR-137]|uniref:S41 family peptidase n=1 Tax=Thalassobaculum sp. OXR-137 TaxID=3100173 RepID=UPI002AC96AF0|nr:S41 family peptidase [Thalassobaculum sp. OXR-137]WPZ33589.1 S41 family peptidase [Thalassobaculum sp. OXR-137]